ncbi:hypothetical protein ZWY2020_037738 [Hordeum vulgare]|nr:hypothetical protein ZWY2020_037738 [Hordeum vulgare]
MAASGEQQQEMAAVSKRRVAQPTKKARNVAAGDRQPEFLGEPVPTRLAKYGATSCSPKCCSSGSGSVRKGVNKMEADGVILRPKTAVKKGLKLTALLKDGTGTKASRARDLFLALATCNTIVPIVEHTVNPAAKLVQYQGESPNEQVLVYAAMAYGHKLVERTSDHIVVAVFGTRQRYEHTNPPIRHDAPALASCLCDKLTM